ncbi:hypothetical protein [Leptospira kirschneri]|uniref:hypothetical protein n=1 Tax=Leptospira kirschneri TaxID=29507 RepID=UPI0035617C9E
MKFIDELIEEELEKLSIVLKEKFQKEIEDGIRNAGSRLRSYVTEGNKKRIRRLAFTRCLSCGSDYVSGYEHFCYIPKGNQNA